MISGDEIVKRLRGVQENVRSRTDLFETHGPFVEGEGTTEAALLAVEAEVGVALPQPLREATLILAGSTWCWSLKRELEDEWDADVARGLGGMIWLSPEGMLAARQQLARVESELSTTALPFAKDSGGEPSYLCVAQVDGELSLIQGHMDGDNECWDLGRFSITCG